MVALLYKVSHGVHGYVENRLVVVDARVIQLKPGPTTKFGRIGGHTIEYNCTNFPWGARQRTVRTERTRRRRHIREIAICVVVRVCTRICKRVSSFNLYVLRSVQKNLGRHCVCDIQDAVTRSGCRWPGADPSCTPVFSPITTVTCSAKHCCRQTKLSEQLLVFRRFLLKWTRLYNFAQLSIFQQRCTKNENANVLKTRDHSTTMRRKQGSTKKALTTRRSYHNQAQRFWN